MNSTLALKDERQGASSIESSEVRKYRIPRTPSAYFEDVVTTAAAVSKFDVGFNYRYFITAPRVDITGLYKASTTTLRTRIVYKERTSVEALLGDKGKRVLWRVVNLIEDASQEYDWPLDHVEVIHTQDTEVENWRYILIVLVFDCDFEVADDYLHNLYEKLDCLSNALGSEELDILQRKLFFDVGTTV